MFCGVVMRVAYNLVYNRFSVALPAIVEINFGSKLFPINFNTTHFKSKYVIIIFRLKKYTISQHKIIKLCFTVLTDI